MKAAPATMRINRHSVTLRAPLPNESVSNDLRMLSYRLRVFDSILHDLIGEAAGRSYVDLGAGPLPFALRAQKAGFKVTAADARPPWTGRSPDGMTVVQADVRQFDLSDYDVIGIVGLLYHLRLEEQVDLLHRCAARPTIIDTEVYCPELVASLGIASPRLYPIRLEHGIEGAIMTETGDLWSSHGNDESFWPTEATLIDMVRDLGWTRMTMVEPPYLSRFGRRRFYVLQ